MTVGKMPVGFAGITKKALAGGAISPCKRFL